VLVLWSDSARRSEYVRSEAATGLYKNKLIQARIDGEAPPRPFDELDAVDLSRWNGDPEDPNWRRLTAMLRSCAGDPVKPPAQAAAPKRAAAAVAPPPPKPEPKRPTPPPIEFADPAPAPPRFVESPPPPPKYEPAPPPRAAEPPPPPPRYEPPPQQRFAEPPPPPPQPRYDPPPSPRYAENDTTRYVDRAEPLRGPRLADSVYRVPQERRDERAERDEALERRAALGRAQLERDRLLVVAEGLEEEGVLALLERRHVPADVALARRILDLDDAGAEVSQMHRAPRAGAVLLDGEDGDVFEWSAHG
jgi:hypothetical protein